MTEITYQTAAEALKIVMPGHRVFIHAGEPGGGVAGQAS